MYRILFLTVCLAVVLAACGGEAAPTTTTTSPTAPLGATGGPTAAVGQPSQASGKVSFAVFGDTGEKAAYDSLVADFEKKYPKIDIELQHIPSQSDYRKRLGTDFAAGTPPNIVLLNYRRYSQFAAKNQLEPVGPYLDKSTLINEADFYPEAIAPYKYKGGPLMCIPQNLSSLVVYYNKKLFDDAKLPYPKDDWTWDQFVDTAKKLTKDTNGDGKPDQYGLGTEASIFRVAPFIWQNGGDVVDNPEAPTKLTLDTPESKEAIQWFVDLQTKHHVAPDAVAEEAQESEARFEAGTTAMFLNSRRGTPTYREIQGFDWDVAPLPRKKEPVTILHADAYCMAAKTENKDAAWAFIEYANAPEGQKTIAASGRTVPSLKAIAESPAFLDPNAKPANSKVFLDSIPTIRAVPVMDTWVDIEETVGEELERAFYGNASVDEMISTATRRTTEYFNKGQ